MSILVDTSIWIDHFNRSDAALARLLHEGLAATHPFVVGELACGNLHQRDVILDLLNGLPHVPKAEDDEVLHLLGQRKLYGKGLGLIDVHLLAACQIGHFSLWTRDKRLHDAAQLLGIAAKIP